MKDVCRHDSFKKCLIEGKVQARRGKRKQQKAFVDQLMEKARVIRYREVKLQMAKNRCK